jgi:lysophospholipase L1-like esterase
VTSTHTHHSRRLAAAIGVALAACLAAPPAVVFARGQAATSAQPATPSAPLDVRRFEQDIVAFEQADRNVPPSRGGILFVGSSIFRLWSTLGEQMAPLPVSNRAFGGSRTAEQLHYFDRVVVPYAPRIIVYYCGSNDVNAGGTPASIAQNYETFSERVRQVLPGTRVYFASIIRAPQKRDRWDIVDAANARVREYSARTPNRFYIDLHPALETAAGEPRTDLYLPDQLHYLPPAYERMTALVKPVIAKAWAEVNASR